MMRIVTLEDPPHAVDCPHCQAPLKVSDEQFEDYRWRICCSQCKKMFTVNPPDGRPIPPAESDPPYPPQPHMSTFCPRCRAFRAVKAAHINKQGGVVCCGHCGWKISTEDNLQTPLEFYHKRTPPLPSVGYVRAPEKPEGPYAPIPTVYGQNSVPPEHLVREERERHRKMSLFERYPALFWLVLIGSIALVTMIIESI